MKNDKIQTPTKIDFDVQLLRGLRKPRLRVSSSELCELHTP